MITRLDVRPIVVAMCMLMLVSCNRKPAEESPKAPGPVAKEEAVKLVVPVKPEESRKAPEPVAKEQAVKVVLPVKPVGKNLEFGIYWTRDSHFEAEASLNRAKGIVTVPGDGSPPSRVIGLSYRHELGDTIDLVPGDGRKVEAIISPETKAVVLKIMVRVRKDGPGSDPADYTAFLIDAGAQALAVQKFSTKDAKGDFLRVQLPLLLSGLKSKSVIRLVILESGTDQGIVIPLSPSNPVKPSEESSASPK